MQDSPYVFVEVRRVLFSRPEKLQGPKVAKSQTKSTVSARIIRADGTIEDLGVLTRSPWYKRLIRRLFHGK